MDLKNYSSLLLIFSALCFIASGAARAKSVYEETVSFKVFSYSLVIFFNFNKFTDHETILDSWKGDHRRLATILGETDVCRMQHLP